MSRVCETSAHIFVNTGYNNVKPMITGNRVQHIKLM